MFDSKWFKNAAKEFYDMENFAKVLYTIIAVLVTCLASMFLFMIVSAFILSPIIMSFVILGIVILAWLASVFNKYGKILIEKEKQNKF